MCQNNQSTLVLLRKGAGINLLGDSITAGLGSSDSNFSGEAFITIKDREFKRQLGKKCWAGLFSDYIADKFPKCTILNNGCSNITSTDVRDHLHIFCKPTDDIYVVMIGTNDRKEIDGMNKLYKNLIYIVQYLKNKNKKVILMSPNPSTSTNESLATRLYHMEDVNNVIAEVAEEENVQFISHYNYIQNYLLFTNKSIDEIMLKDKDKTDGLHPTDEVYSFIFRNLIQSLNLGVKVNEAIW